MRCRQVTSWKAGKTGRHCQCCHHDQRQQYHPSHSLFTLSFLCRFVLESYRARSSGSTLYAKPRTPPDRKILFIFHPLLFWCPGTEDRCSQPFRGISNKDDQRHCCCAVFPARDSQHILWNLYRRIPDRGSVFSFYLSCDTPPMKPHKNESCRIYKVRIQKRQR